MVFSKVATLAVLSYWFIKSTVQPKAGKLTAEDQEKDKLAVKACITHFHLYLGAQLLAIIIGAQIWGGAPMFQPWTPLEMIAAALSLFGSLIRLWSMNELGRHFTFVVAIRKAHKLVQTGPYALLRHPSYTGLTLGALGIAYYAGLRNWTWFIPVVELVIMMAKRVQREEGVMHEAFGKEWEEYCKRTWRMIPFLI